MGERGRAKRSLQLNTPFVLYLYELGLRSGLPLVEISYSLCLYVRVGEYTHGILSFIRHIFHKPRAKFIKTLNKKMASKRKIEASNFQLPKKIKLSDDAVERETKIRNIDSTVLS